MDNTGIGVPVNAGGLLGMGEGCDGLDVLDGVGIQTPVDAGVDVCISVWGVSVLLGAGVGILRDKLVGG